MCALATATPSDADLVRAYRGGDERGAAGLVERHAPAVARYLGASGLDDGDIDDLLQETFIRAFGALDSWRKESAFRSWVVSIAANLLRDQYRRARHRTTVPLDDGDLPSPCRTGCPPWRPAAPRGQPRTRVTWRPAPTVARNGAWCRPPGGSAARRRTGCGLRRSPVPCSPACMPGSGGPTGRDSAGSAGWRRPRRWSSWCPSDAGRRRTKPLPRRPLVAVGFHLPLAELDQADAEVLEAVLDQLDAPVGEGSSMDAPSLGDLDDTQLERVLRSLEG
ncbi:MAG: sigma-70 family RNA polymerase sigma factor [Gemmatimonadetes bacterium]|nr:sigma-70 family RNA polymerase sigma factor [Gemmatimonadota bacterium]